MYLRNIFLFPKIAAQAIRLGMERERALVLIELSEVKGILPLLMKHRNGGLWTPTEREILVKDLRALSHLSPYLIPAIMPGGMLILPILAWWLDRRRIKRLESHV